LTKVVAAAGRFSPMEQFDTLADLAGLTELAT
jgi:hypothetical protein